MPASVHPTRSRLLLGLAAALAASVATGSGAPRAEARPATTRRPVVGFAINAHHISDLPLYLRSVDAIADLGANTLLLVTPMFQRRVDSSAIEFLPDRCPTDDQLLAILDRARSHGLRTALLPIVLIAEPGEKDWRGVIRPADRAAWWESYDRFVDRYLDLAIRADVDIFSVGSELNAFEPEVDRWRAIIDRVRARFAGQVTYTSNWDRFDKVRFWPLVDFIAVSSYFELSRDDPAAPLPALVRAWRGERARMMRVADRFDRRILLMELGYPSLPWAAAHPWNYVAGEGDEADHEAQARCWQAFFDAWTDAVVKPDGRFLGFNCYCWDPYHRGERADTGYGVDGKPARAVIQAAFARIRAETAVDP